MFSSENIKKELLLRKKELTPIYLFRNFWSSSSLEISESLFLMIFKLRRCFRPLLKRFRLWLAAEEPVKPLPTLASILFELVATSFVSFENIFRLGGRWIEGLLVNAELRLYWFWCFHGNDSNDEDGDKFPATHRITINSGLQVFVSARSIRISHNCYWIPVQQQEKMKI